MNTIHKNWVISLTFGFAFSILIFASMFFIGPSSPIAPYIGWPMIVIHDLHIKYKIPPYGGDEEFAWCIIGPVIGFVTWFIIGTSIGHLWMKYRRNNSLNGQIFTEELCSRQLAIQIRNQPEYNDFLADNQQHRFLYDEDLPADFAKWFDQKQSEQLMDVNRP